jgi:hypothetical protein
VLKERADCTILYNQLANRVGNLLMAHMNEQLSSFDLHGLVTKEWPEKAYTRNQVKRALAWHLDNNPDYVKSRLGCFNNKTRLYWFEDVSQSA